MNFTRKELMEKYQNRMSIIVTYAMVFLIGLIFLYKMFQVPALNLPIIAFLVVSWKVEALITVVLAAAFFFFASKDKDGIVHAYKTNFGVQRFANYGIFCAAITATTYGILKSAIISRPILSLFKIQPISPQYAVPIVGIKIVIFVVIAMIYYTKKINRIRTDKSIPKTK